MGSARSRGTITGSRTSTWGNCRDGCRARTESTAWLGGGLGIRDIQV